MKHLFAFYGSLRKGEYNYNRLLYNKQGVKLMSTKVIPNYNLYSLGAYPVILPTEKENNVIVDIFQIDNKDIKEWIKLMELGAGYREKTINIEEYKNVTIYVGGNYHKSQESTLQLVPNGDWVRYNKI